MEQIRVRSGDVHNNLDGVRATNGRASSANDDGVRAIGSYAAQTNGGIGGDELTRQRAAASRHGNDSRSTIDKGANQAEGHLGDLISGSRAAASSKLHTIS